MANEDTLSRLLTQPRRNPLKTIGGGLQAAGAGLLGQVVQPQQETSLADELSRTIAIEQVKGDIKSQRDKEFFESLGITGTPDDGGISSDLPPGTTVSRGGLNIPLVPKKSAAQEKREVEASELSQGLEGLLTSFNRATAAGKEQIPFFGARGPVGRISGLVGKKLGEAGLAPEIDVFNAQKDAFATTVAKAAGEVRPTDEDIRRFVKTLPSPSRTDEENALIVADIQSKIAQGKTADLWTGGASAKEAANTLTTPSGISFTFRRK